MGVDPFPPEEFDAWAESYDQDVQDNHFPFTGYAQVLDTVVALAQAQPGMHVLDLGTGTGNLALRFAELGCEVWGTDFSFDMLAKARSRLPEARFFLADLRAAWPPELDRRFDRIVSAYVFHHFELPEKVKLAHRLVTTQLEPGGALTIADLSFPDQAAKSAVQAAEGNRWEEEPYWIAAAALPALAEAGLQVEYHQVSVCAGVYHIRAAAQPGAGSA